MQLHSIRAPVCSIKLYTDSLVRELVAINKERQRAYTVCHMDVKVKKMLQQMAHRIGRREILVGAAPPCGFCGNSDARCHLAMNKAKTPKLVHLVPMDAFFLSRSDRSTKCRLCVHTAVQKFAD